MLDRQMQSGWLPTRPKRLEFSTCSCPFQSAYLHIAALYSSTPNVMAGEFFSRSISAVNRT
jgi:hypothetical protein